MKRVFIILVLFTGYIFAQVEYSGGARSASAMFNFAIDYSVHKSTNPAKTRLDFFIQLPYSSVQFVKKDNSFHAAYNVTLSFMDEGKNNIIIEKSWKERIKTDDFQQTISRENFNLSYKTMDINPGNYFLKSIVEDSDSRQTSIKEFPVTVRALNDSISLSDPTLIAEFISDSTGQKIIPNVSKNVSNRTTGLPFFYEIYSSKVTDALVEYIVQDFKRGKSEKFLDPVKLKIGSNLVTHTIQKSDFAMGDYLLRVELKDNEWKLIDAAEKKFTSKIFGLPTSIIDLDKAIQQMLYIASSSDRSYIEEAQNYDEKLARFLAFWDKKKPNQNSVENPILYEYYRRIEYANKNFKGLGEGWRSDMGLIYITFGPPSSVERHPMDMDSKPYEIWDYYELNRYFMFADYSGFGDFRLVNPDYSRWPGYRP